MPRALSSILAVAIFLAPILCTCTIAAPAKRACCAKSKEAPLSQHPRCPHCGKAPQIQSMQSHVHNAVPALAINATLLPPSAPLIARGNEASNIDQPRILLDLFHNSCLLTV